MSHTVLSIPRPDLRSPRCEGELPTSVLNIGLTGGIGSGKSTVVKMLRARGVTVIDLDSISHALTQAGGQAMPQIIEVFGARASQPDGALNRAHMRAQVFGNIENRRKLERIMHPLIAQNTIAKAHQYALEENVPVIVYDIPLLAESGFWTDRLDWICVIECARATQIERVKLRSPQMSVTDIELIIDAQARPEERRSIANVLINNEKNHNNRLNLARQVDILVQHINVLLSQSGSIRE